MPKDEWLRGRLISPVLFLEDSPPSSLRIDEDDRWRVIASYNSLPFKDSEFETVVLDNILNVVECDPVSVLEEAKRVSCSRILISVPASESYYMDEEGLSDNQRQYDYTMLLRHCAKAGIDAGNVVRGRETDGELVTHMAHIHLKGV